MMVEPTFLDSLLAFVRENPLIPIGLILALALVILRRRRRLPMLEQRLGRLDGDGGANFSPDATAAPAPPREAPSAPARQPAPQPGGAFDGLPKTDRLDRPAREATEPERPRSHGTPIGGPVREPDGVVSKKEAEEAEDDILIIQDETLAEPDAPASEKPASPAQPARRREQEEPDPDAAVTPVAPAGSQLPPLDDGLFGRIPPAPPAPAPSPIPAAAEPKPDREVAPPEPEEAAEAPAPAPIEFAAHYPREIKPGPDEWQPLLAYLYRETAADAVEADAKERLGPRPDVRVTRRPALGQVQTGALVIATPVVPGLEFNPPSAVVRFVKDWHRFEFEFRAVDAPLDEAANGRITFMVEGLIVGDVPLSVYVSESAASAETQVTQAHPYRAIFCSYSHKDTAIVELVELAVRTLGDQYLRDMTTLRSGEDWNDALMRLIDEADIFQLFWSENAAGSKFVEEEWRYALSLKASQTKDDHFLRPVRWVDPINPNPPADLGRIEFFFEPRLLHWRQVQPGDPPPPAGLHPGGSGTP